MTDVRDVGVICTVCHCSNNGLSDFCECRESLIGYRPLNTRSADRWVEAQLSERSAIGISTTDYEVEALRRWATRSDSRSTPELTTRRNPQGIVIVVLWGWLVLSLLLTYFMTARQVTFSDAGIYLIITVVPILTLATIATVLFRRRAAARALQRSSRSDGVNAPGAVAGEANDRPGGPDWWLASDGKWYPPQPLAAPGAPATNRLAVASLVASILLLGVGSIIAIILGHVALSQIKDSNGKEGGRGMAIAGLTIGYIGVAFVILMLLGIATLSMALRTS
jgi:hypothetical protein